MRMRSCVVALLVGLACGFLSVASAGAKTVTVGQLFTPAQVSCFPGTALVPSVASGNSYRIPKAGVITSWSFHDGANTVPGLKLKVGRHAGGGTFKIVGSALAGTQTPNAVHTYHVHIRVRAGDLIGEYENGGSCGTQTGTTADKYWWINTSEARRGTTTGFHRLHGFKFPVSVVVKEN